MKRTPQAGMLAILCVVVVVLVCVLANSGLLLHAAADDGQRAPSPIPKAGPLARPKSTHQAGVPLAATQAAIPADNPQTPEKIALGEKLFFDGRLSAGGSVACSTCHDPVHAFTDARPASIGIKGLTGQRNAPRILNALYSKTQFWDGRVNTLEEQAAFPIINPVEMGQPRLEAAVAQIAKIDEYRKEFQRVFGRAPNGKDLVQAIAAYERTQISFDSPFDHFIDGEKNAISDSAKRGWEIFNTRGRCNKCHALSETPRDVTTFTDNDFHNIGIGVIRHNVVALACQAEKLIHSSDTLSIDRAAMQTEMSALGRFLVTKKDEGIAAFKTPDLRNVLVTAPYFHDGSQATLWDVVDHYNKGDGLQNPYLDEDIQPLALTEADIDDVVAFMASLTSPEYAKFGRKGTRAATGPFPDKSSTARYRAGVWAQATRTATLAELRLEGRSNCTRREHDMKQVANRSRVTPMARPRLRLIRNLQGENDDTGRQQDGI